MYNILTYAGAADRGCASHTFLVARVCLLESTVSEMALDVSCVRQFEILFGGNAAVTERTLLIEK